jgi:hypothetical protein
VLNFPDFPTTYDTFNLTKLEVLGRFACKLKIFLSVRQDTTKGSTGTHSKHTNFHWLRLYGRSSKRLLPHSLCCEKLPLKLSYCTSLQPPWYVCVEMVVLMCYTVHWVHRHGNHASQRAKLKLDQFALSSWNKHQTEDKSLLCEL